MATMTDDLVYGYCEITKTEKTPDGLMVWGQAAGPELDMDEQRCDPVWLKAAMPEWMRWGNVREQHQAIAAGVGKELTEQGDKWFLKSLVVDPVTIKKVETGVLKGYSVGVKHGRVVKAANAPKGLINGGNIVEVSLVDRPANPAATITICKAAGLGGVWAPVDGEGEVLKLVEPDIIKAAKQTVADVLHGDLLADLDDAGDTPGAIAALGRVCDAIIFEANVIKSAAADGEVSIDGLQDAVSALTEFADDDDGDGSGVDDPDYDGIEDDAAAYTAELEAAEDELVEKMLARAKADGYLVKAAGVRSADDVAPIVDADATLNTAEIIKAAVAEVRGPLEAKIESLQADLTKAMAAPVGGGPVLIAPATRLDAPRASEADRLLAIASNPNVDAHTAALYRARAAEVEGAAA